MKGDRHRGSQIGGGNQTRVDITPNVDLHSFLLARVGTCYLLDCIYFQFSSQSAKGDGESDRLQVTGWERQKEGGGVWALEVQRSRQIFQVALCWDSQKRRGSEGPTGSCINQNDLQHRRSRYRASCSPRPPETDRRHQS